MADKGLGLIEFYAVHAEDSDESQGNTKPIMDSWSLMALTSTEIEVSLSFSDPLNVSAGDSPDLLLVQLDLSEYKDDKE